MQIEEELESSKKSRRAQTDEFEQKIKEIAEVHDKELKDLRETFEKEKYQLTSSAQQQRELLVANHTQVCQSWCFLLCLTPDLLLLHVYSSYAALCIEHFAVITRFLTGLLVGVFRLSAPYFVLWCIS